MENEKISPVSIYHNKEGKAWVRIRTLDEDFLLGIRDLEFDDKKRFEWVELMKYCNQYDILIPSKKQWTIVSAYIDEVNQAMIEAGGYDLKSKDYWSSTQYGGIYAWLLFNGTIGLLDYRNKLYYIEGRALDYPVI